MGRHKPRALSQELEPSVCGSFSQQCDQTLSLYPEPKTSYVNDAVLAILIIVICTALCDFFACKKCSINKLFLFTRMSINLLCMVKMGPSFFLLSLLTSAASKLNSLIKSGVRLPLSFEGQMSVAL